MKFSLSIIIDSPREKVVELFRNPANLKFWQKGFISSETYKGEPGQEGARSKQKHQEIKGITESTETITKLNLPEAIQVTYNTENVTTEQRNTFSEQDGKTKWTCESESKFSGAMKFTALMLGSEPYQKQRLQTMEDFKAFAEGKPRYGVKKVG